MNTYNLELRPMAVTTENTKKKIDSFTGPDNRKEEIGDIYGNGYLQIFTKGGVTVLQINRTSGTKNITIGPRSLFNKIMAAEARETTGYMSPWRKFNLYENGENFIDILVTPHVTWLEINTDYE